MTGASSLTTVLLHGVRGAGATALAAKMAVESGAPLVKLITPANTVGMGDAQKASYIERSFADAYKSKSSVIVLDSLERMFSWIPIGPRFSMAILDLILNALNKQPPAGHRLLVFATTSIPSVLDELGFDFGRRLEVPPVANSSEVATILQEYGQFSRNDIGRTLQAYGKDDVNVGVKKIISAIDLAKKEQDPSGTFARLLGALEREANASGSGIRAGRDLRAAAMNEADPMKAMY